MPQANTPFQTQAELQAAHESLIERFEAAVAGAGETPTTDTSASEDDAERHSLIAILDPIRDFLVAGAAAGAYLHESKERRAAQGLLDYWASLCYGAQLDIQRAQLAPYNPSLRPTLADEACPYVGLEAFGEPDTRRFFGREERTAALLQFLRVKRLVVVTGSSGSGKSSLVLAGALPVLRQGAIDGSDGWCYVPPLVPGATPLENLAQALAGALHVGATAAGRERWQAEQVKLMQADPQHLVALLDATGRTAVIVIDQFEETMTLRTEVNAPAFAAFVASLGALVDSPSLPHRVVLTMRNDVDTRLAREYPDLNRKYGPAAFPLSSMDSKQLRDAIEAPAAQAGLKFQDGVVDDLIRSVVGEDASLPLLQFNLMSLWERRHGNLVTLQDHLALGSPRAAMAAEAARLYAALPSEQQMSAQRIFLALSRQGDGAAVFRNRMTRAQLHQVAEPNLADRVIARFEQARLLRVLRPDADDRLQDTVEVAHEALLRNWDLLQRLFAERRDERERRAFLRKQAQKWREAGFNPAFLLSGLALRQAEAEFPLAEMNALEREYFEKSQESESLALAAATRAADEQLAFQKAKADAAVELASLQKTKADAAVQIASQLRRAGIVSLAVVLLAAAAAGFAWWRTQSEGAERLAAAESKAQDQIRAAAAEKAEILASAKTIKRDAELSNMAARDAMAAAYSAMSDSAIKRDQLQIDLKRAEADRLVLDARMTASTDGDKSIQLASDAVRLDPAAIKRVTTAVVDASRVRRADMRLAAGRIGAVEALTLDAAGQRLLVAGDSEITEWQLGEGGKVSQIRRSGLPDKFRSVTQVIYAPGSHLAAIGGDNQVWLWDEEPGAQPRALLPAVGALRLSISSDAKVLAAISADSRQVLAWSLPDGKLLLKFERKEGERSLAVLGFSDADRQLVALEYPEGDIENKALVFKRNASGLASTPLTLPLPRCDELSGVHALGGGKYGLMLKPQLCEHDLELAATPGNKPRSSEEKQFIDDIIYSNDSRYLVKLIRRANELQIVERASGATLRLQGAFDLQNTSSYEQVLSISGNGERLAVLGADGSIRLFTLGSGVAELTDRGTEWVSPDETVMIARSSNGGAAVYEARDLRSGKLLRKLGGAARLVHFELDADGKTLYSETPECRQTQRDSNEGRCLIVSQDLQDPASAPRTQPFESVQGHQASLYVVTNAAHRMVYAANTGRVIFTTALADPPTAGLKAFDSELRRMRNFKTEEVVIGNARTFAVKRFADNVISVDIHAVEGQGAKVVRQIERPTAEGYLLTLPGKGKALQLSGPSQTELWDLRTVSNAPTIVTKGRDITTLVNGSSGIVAQRVLRGPWKLRDLRDGHQRGELPARFRVDASVTQAWTDRDEDFNDAWQVRSLASPATVVLAGKGAINDMQFSEDGTVVAVTLPAQALLRIYRIASASLLLELDRSAVDRPTLTAAGGFLRDGDGRLFPADAAKLLARAQAEVKRRLTARSGY